MKKILLMPILIGFASSAFADENFSCPQSFEIQSTNFTKPSIWTAPPMRGTNGFGVGLGGDKIGQFLGMEKATINHHEGWICVYKSEGGDSPRVYEEKILKIVGSTPYLYKYQKKIQKEFNKAEPYLQKYTGDVGFVGYEKKI